MVQACTQQCRKPLKRLPLVLAVQPKTVYVLIYDAVVSGNGIFGIVTLVFNSRSQYVFIFKITGEFYSGYYSQIVRFSESIICSSRVGTGASSAQPAIIAVAVCMLYRSISRNMSCAGIVELQQRI